MALYKDSRCASQERATHAISITMLNRDISKKTKAKVPFSISLIDLEVSFV